MAGVKHKGRNTTNNSPALLSKTTNLSTFLRPKKLSEVLSPLPSAIKTQKQNLKRGMKAEYQPQVKMNKTLV